MENHILLVIVALIAAVALFVLGWQIIGFRRKLGGYAKPKKKEKGQAEGGFVL